MNDIAAVLACIGGCLFWAAWRENKEGNYRDRTLLATFGITVTCAGTVFAALA